MFEPNNKQEHNGFDWKNMFQFRRQIVFVRKKTHFSQQKKKPLSFSSHHLVTAAVSGGNLYIAHVTIGDKRWFKGAKIDAEGIYNSFTVA